MKLSTIPAEESTLLAQPKAQPKKSKAYTGLIVAAAVTSFALGACAVVSLGSASGTSMRPAGAAQTMLKKLDYEEPRKASYKVEIACLDKKNEVLWNTKNWNKNKVTWGTNNYPLPDALKGTSDWSSTDFDYVETSEYVLKHEWAQKCHGFSIAVGPPEGTDAPKFRVYQSDGKYFGSFDTGDNINSASDKHPVVANLPKNLGGVSEPWSLKNSVFLEKAGGIVQGNRYLLVSIGFEAKEHIRLNWWATS
jgi:hypothetical protein